MDPLRAMLDDRAVAVVRAEHVEEPRVLADVLAAAGIRCVEFTFTIRDVLAAIASAAEGDAVVGAGTVLRPEQARAAIAAGAAFVVSPVCAPELAEPCREEGVPLFLGAFTPTEIHEAVEAGAAAIKLFPASLGGPAYLKQLAAPFPQLPLVPSGGIDERNAREYLDAGAVAVYAGSGLAPAALVERGDHDEIRRRAQGFAAALT